MIHKEPDYQKALDRLKELLGRGGLRPKQREDLVRIQAGFQAEKEMAYQLRAFLGSHPELHVIHNLKIEHNGDTAQIDHLVLSRRAVYFVESKSVSEALSVNQYGEWFRQYNGQLDPIDSPVEQSKRHQALLLALLEANCTAFMGKVLGMQKHVGTYTPKHFVAVSTKGRIEGDGRGLFKEVMKYDQVPSAIRDHHKATDKGFWATLTSDNTEEWNTCSEKELTGLIAFLLGRDVALEPIAQVEAVAARIGREQEPVAKAPPKPKAEPAPAPKPVLPGCKHCNSVEVKVAYGPYGYYFKCMKCDKNTPINVSCPKCSQKAKIRKDKQRFHVGCESCGVESLFFENPPEADPAAIETQEKKCPKCGLPMAIRVSKKGERQGEKFWGCSGFPKCRTILAVEGP